MLSKKKIFITILALFIILSLSCISILAFEFRDPVKTATSSSDLPTLEAVQNLAGIINYQCEIGQLRVNSWFVLAWDYNHIVVYLIDNGINVNIAVSGNSVTYTGVQPLYQYQYNSTYGFFYVNRPNSVTLNLNNIYYSDFTIESTYTFTGFNQNATFGTNNWNSTEIYNYYDYIYRSCVEKSERESSIYQEAYSEGLATGQGEGYQIGLEDGYNQGYDSGYADGEDRGYIEGQTEGYSEGFSEGYSEGESVGAASGYRDGFDDGREEGYTIGYDVGYDDGYKRGEDIGYQTGFSEGYESGYDEGYTEGYETGYNIVYDDLQQPGTIQAIFTTKDSSGNTLYLAQKLDLENSEIDYNFVPKDQISNSIDDYTLFVKTYNVTQYLEKNPLDFDYTLPVIEYKNTDFLALYRKVNVTREYFDLYSIYSFVEITIDQSFIDQLNNQYNEGLNDANALVNGIGDIAAKPITSLKDALDFEIFGLNIGVVAVGIVAILFAIWAYNKIRKVLPI